MMLIRSVAVLGAGTMGAQIAALFASIGVDVWLLDVTPQAARDGLDRARRLKPDPFFTPDAIARIRTGGFDDSMNRVGECEWVIEAIVERLDVKQALLARVDAARKTGSIVSTNTSGLSINTLAQGRSDDFRRHWLGTHFFNPPRYLRLLEIVPSKETDPDVLARVTEYADLRLGKGIVVAKDTPNFVANHIGIYGMFPILEAVQRGAYGVAEIDAMTGPAIGRPKSATFRTLDLVGIDVFLHVARTLAEEWTDPEARTRFTPPAFVGELAARGWIGEKAGQGFYKRVKDASGHSQVLALDPQTFEYRPTGHTSLPALEAARSIENTGERIRVLFTGQDRVGEFLRAISRVATLDDVERALQ